MTPTIDIYNVDGSVLMTAVVTKNGERRESLMTEDCILLKWSAADYIMLPEGAYISGDDGERYRLVNPYYPAQKNELRCEYAPEFLSRVMCWSTVPLFFYTYAADGKTITSRETDWTLTGTPADFMAYFARVIREETGEAWSVTVSDDIPVTSATVKFESTDVLSGINSVASAFGTEWRADKKSNTLHLGAAAHGAPVRLTVGGNVSVPSTSMSKAEYGNRYYVFGSSRNITQTYEGANVNNLVTRRLTLDPAKYPGGYIDTRQGLKAGEIVPRFLTFDDVYPRSALEAYDVRCRLVYRLDEVGDKIQVGTDGEGQPLYDQYAVWYFKTRDKVTGKQYLFDIADLIKGQVLSVSFLGGALNGRDFELTYHDKSKVVNTSDGTPLQVDKGDFEINFVEEGGYIIPAVTALVPKDGDALSLFNINMPAEYHASAYLELETAALAEINRRLRDLNNYEVSSNPVEFYNDDPELTVGRNVIFVNVDGKEIHTRVLSIVRKLDRPCEQKITLGNELVKGAMSEIKDEVVNANSSLSILAQLQQLNTAFTQAYTRTQQQLLEGMAQMSRLWYLDEDGNVCTDRNVCSAKDIVALGKKSAGIGGGNGGGASALWELTDVDVADAANGDIIVYNSATQKWVNVSQSSLRPDLSDYATRVWVQSQGYLTQHQSLADYATRAWVNAQEFVKASALDLYLPLTGGTLTGPLTMGGDGVHRIYFADKEHYIELDADGNFHFSHNVYSDEDIVALGSKSWAGSAFGGSLADLSDVKLTDVSIGDLIQWNGTDWVNVKASELGVGSGNVDLTAYLKVDGSNGTASGVSALIRALGAAAAEVKDSTLIVTSDNEGQTDAKPNYYRRQATAFWQYILNKDGSGSGLDADMLDGLHASSFLTGIPTAACAADFNTYMSGLRGVTLRIGSSTETYGAIRKYDLVFDVGNEWSRFFRLMHNRIDGNLRFQGSVEAAPGGWATERTLLDTVNYAGLIDGRYVTLTTAQTISGAKTFSQSISFPDISSGSSAGIFWSGSTDYAKIYYRVQSADLGRLVFEVGDDNDPCFIFKVAGKEHWLAGDKFYMYGAIQGNSIIKTGGTSSQFLKADGSVDGTQYLYHRRISGLNIDTGITASGGGLYEINKATGTLPFNADWHKVFDWGANDNSYRVQLLSSLVTDGSLYLRHMDHGTWRPWRTILDSVNYATTLDGRYVKKAGDTMSGALTVPSLTATGSIYMQTSSVLQFKENGWGDKFGIWGSFSGADDENKMYIGSAVGAQGTDPALSAKITMLLKSGNVGIGTTTPADKLHMHGGAIRVTTGDANDNRYLCIRTNIEMRARTGAGHAEGVYLYTNDGSTILGQLCGVLGSSNAMTYLYYGGTSYTDPAMVILPNKTIVMGATANSSGAKLHVVGNVYSTLDMVAANSSDRRLKHRFADEDYADKLLRLGCVMSYEWRDMAREMDPDKYDALRHSSVVWQRARKVGIPGFCGIDERGYGYVNWLNKDYQATLLGAVQDHERRLRAIEKELTGKCA